MATPQFHSLRIREVRPETADAVTVSFDVPETLRDAFRFTQGQFVTLKTHIDGEETRRSYSICVGVTDYDRDGELRIGIKRVRGGRFSNFAFDTLKPGHEIEVMTPDGRFFTHLNADHVQALRCVFGRFGHHAGACHHQDDARNGADQPLHADLRQSQRRRDHVRRGTRRSEEPLHEPVLAVPRVIGRFAGRRVVQRRAEPGEMRGVPRGRSFPPMQSTKPSSAVPAR